MDMKKIRASSVAFALAIAVAACNGCGDKGNGGGGDGGGPTPDAGGAKLPAIAPAEAGKGGSVTGKVSWKGEKPAREDLNVSGVKLCKDHATAHGNPKDETIVVNDNGTVRDVIVFIKASGSGFTPPAQPAKLDQVGCVYVPHVVTVMTGQTMKIHSSDDTLHNVNAKGKKAGNAFNEPMASVGELEKKFKNPEVFAIACNVHSWMQGFIGVFDHPFHVVTGTDGTFKLSDVPPGEWEIVAWHGELGEKSTKVKVEAGKAAEANFEMSQ
jgi:plastocyanin